MLHFLYHDLVAGNSKVVVFVVVPETAMAGHANPCVQQKHVRVYIYIYVY